MFQNVTVQMESVNRTQELAFVHRVSQDLSATYVYQRLSVMILSLDVKTALVNTMELLMAT